MKPGKWLALGVAALCAAALIGCAAQKQYGSLDDGQKQNIEHLDGTGSNDAIPTNVTDISNADPQHPPAEPQTANPPVSDDAQDEKVETSSDNKPLDKPSTAEKPSRIDNVSGKPVRDALMGLRLSDTRTTVEQKYGKPETEYEMEDEPNPIAVYEYAGFSVGFDASGTIVFVEITSKDTDPGLNGLKLGHSVKSALDALGEPDTRTDYALSYNTGESVLKLDVDPKTGTIQSIKLFANN